MRLTTVLAFLLLTAPLLAQDNRVHLDVLLPPPPGGGSEGPSVVAANLLADGKTRELLRNGFPAALHFRAELWRKSRWFDDPAGVTEWTVLVQYEPSSQLYRVVRQHGNNQLEDFGGFATLASAEAQIDRAYRIALRPTRSGRYYYVVALEIQTLTVSDLDALQRWLRGEAQPAVRGQSNPLTALRRGFETLLSRVLGGENRRYEQRSGIFSVG